MENLPNIKEAITIWCPINHSEAEMIAELASVGFSADKIATCISRDKRLFLRDFRMSGTPVYEAYKKGEYLAEAEVGKILLENATKGNLTAIQQLAKVRELQHIENIKQEIFNTD